jgi:hypothetical protein
MGFLVYSLLAEEPQPRLKFSYPPSASSAPGVGAHAVDAGLSFPYQTASARLLTLPSHGGRDGVGHAGGPVNWPLASP